MFLTSPSFEYKLPRDKRALDGQIWRGVEAFWDVGAFIARFRFPNDSEGHERTLMFSSAADVVHLVDGPLKPRLKSLTFLRLTRNDRPTRFVAEDIHEIHRATDARADGGEVIVVQSASGEVFRTDQLVGDAGSVVNPRLVVRIED